MELCKTPTKEKIFGDVLNVTTTMRKDGVIFVREVRLSAEFNILQDEDIK